MRERAHISLLKHHKIPSLCSQSPVTLLFCKLFACLQDQSAIFTGSLQLAVNISKHYGLASSVHGSVVDLLKPFLFCIRIHHCNFKMLPTILKDFPQEIF